MRRLLLRYALDDLLGESATHNRSSWRYLTEDMIKCGVANQVGSNVVADLLESLYVRLPFIRQGVSFHGVPKLLQDSHGHVGWSIPLRLLLVLGCAEVKLQTVLQRRVEKSSLGRGGHQFCLDFLVRLADHLVLVYILDKVVLLQVREAVSKHAPDIACEELYACQATRIIDANQLFCGSLDDHNNVEALEIVVWLVGQGLRLGLQFDHWIECLGPCQALQSSILPNGGGRHKELRTRIQFRDVLLVQKGDRMYSGQDYVLRHLRTEAIQSADKDTSCPDPKRM